MSNGAYVAFTGAAAGLAALEVIANNVANAGTPGFRRDEVLFNAMLGGELAFAQASGTTVDLTGAPLRPTESPLHAAVLGDGFFVVQGADGAELLTRRGDFRLDAEGRLVLPGGLAVVGSSGTLTVPAGTQGRLEADGTLYADGSAVGKLRIARVEDPSTLGKHGDLLLVPSPKSPPVDVEVPQIAVGSVEESNVNVAAEMVALIQASRSFEAAMQSLRVSDDLTQRLIQTQG
jgi:flagellar basal-body rod protein FlgF